MQVYRAVSTSIAVAVFAMGFLSTVGYADSTHHFEAGNFPFQALHEKLHLSREQEKFWQSLRQKDVDFRKSAREQHNEMKVQVKHELDKKEPDLAALAAKSDQLSDARLQERRQLRGQWLKFYAQLAPEQKELVRNAIKTRLAKMDKFHEKFKHRGEGRTPS